MENLPISPKRAAAISGFLESITGEYYFTPEVRMACLAILTEKPDASFEEVRLRALRETIPMPIVFESSK